MKKLEKATNLRCGVCKHPIGKGKGKRTGASISEFEVKIYPTQMPQLRGLIVPATVNFCIKCIEGFANELIMEEHKATLIKAGNLNS
jgi:hypothetical protein